MLIASKDEATELHNIGNVDFNVVPHEVTETFPKGKSTVEIISHVDGTKTAIVKSPNGRTRFYKNVVQVFPGEPRPHGLIRLVRTEDGRTFYGRFDRANRP